MQMLLNNHEQLKNVEFHYFPDTAGEEIRARSGLRFGGAQARLRLGRFAERLLRDLGRELLR